MNEAVRLERLEEALDLLRQGAAGAAVVVEGPRDRAALEALGVGGTHIVVNQGRGLEVLIDQTVEATRQAGWPRVILMMDWDRTGARLQRRLEEGFAGRIPVEVQLRARLRRVSHTTSFEEVPFDLAGLRRRVGGRP